MGKIYDWESVEIADGKSAAVAKYSDHKLPEYNNNPLIQALPAILSGEEFVEKVMELPSYAPQEREFDAHHRFHCVERLSRFFQPLNKTINLQQVVCALLMQGYLARNISKPEFARQSRQIYEAIKAGDGRNIENHVNVPTSTSASGLTLIGPSGMGKSTNFINILNLYPQVILHKEYNTHQIVWLKVDCPHRGSLKGLCTDIFLGVDRLLGTNYFKKFGASRNSEDNMLAQVAQIAHTHHLGLLVIDEMQNLVTARRSCSDMLNFLVKMDNIIGVPVIRIGTNEAFPILQGNFRNARRGTGEGSVIWDRMNQDEEWYFFMETMWEFQWTKILTDFSDEFNEIFYEESQGIIDIAIKLYKMVQWRAISLGGKEIISSDLIKQAAKDGLYLVKPMLDAIRSRDEQWMIKYKDIAPIDTTEYQKQCLSNIETKDLKEISRLARKQQNNGHLLATQRHVILKLLELDVEPITAKECAEQVVISSQEDTNIPSLVKQAYALALGGKIQETTTTAKVSNQKSKATSTRKPKAKPKYQENDIRQIVENAKKNETTAYEGLKSANIIKNPVEDFISVS